MRKLFRLLTSSTAAVYYCVAASAFEREFSDRYGGVGLASSVVQWLWCHSLALWMVSDAKHRRRPLPYDFDGFAFLAWPLVIPWYLISTRRWWTVLIVGGLLLFSVAASTLASYLMQGCND